MARSEQELRQRFMEDPTALDAFSSLRRLYQKEERWEDLAWLYEHRAQALSDPQRKADMYFKAGDVYLNKLQKPEAGLDSLYQGILLDPRHRKNARTVVQLLEEAGDTERLKAVLEKLVEYHAAQGDKRGQLDYRLRLAAMERESGDLMKAAVHYKAVLDIDPRRRDALKALADILMESKEREKALPLLEKLASEERDPGERARLLHDMARIHLDARRDPVKAEQLMTEAERLDPENMEYKTFLIEIYQDKRYPDREEGGRKAAKLFLDMARRHLKAGNRDKAKEAYRQAIAIDGYLMEAYSGYASMLEEEGNWEELVSVLSRGAKFYSDIGQTAVHLEITRAQILISRLGKPGEGYKILEDLLDDPEAFFQVVKVLEPHYREEGDILKLLKLKEKLARRLTEEMERLESSMGAGRDRVEKKKREAVQKLREDLVSTLLELADFYRNELERPHQAAKYLHRILQLDPENMAARNQYIYHFKEIGDNKRLAETIEFLLKKYRSRISTDEQVKFLVELATLYLKKLGDLERGTKILRALSKMMPDKYQAHYEKSLKKWQQWHEYRERYEQAIEATQDPDERLARMRQLAGIMREKGLDVSRAISLYSELLNFYPDDPELLEGMEELLEREGNWEELYRLQTKKLAGATPEQAEEILSAMLEIQEEKIGEPREIRKIAHSLLKMMPQDERAAKAYVRALEELEDWKNLARSLEKLALILTADDEREDTLKKAARIYEYELGDRDNALRIWLYLHQEGYGDPAEVVTKILDLYEALDQPDNEAKFLDELLSVGLWPDDDRETAELWGRLARLYESRLGDSERAYSAWMHYLDILPDSKDALVKAVGLAYSLERWDDLTDLLSQQIRMASDKNQKMTLTLRLADIYQYQLGDLEEAVTLLARVYKSGLDPEIRERLIELYLEIDEPEHAIELLAQAAKASDEKIPYLLRMAEIYIDAMDDLESATRIYDRILQIDPDNIDVLKSQLRLLEEQGDWERVVASIRKIIDHLDDPGEQMELALKNGRIYEQELDDAARAFDWYLRVFEMDRSSEHLANLERVAEGDSTLEERLLVVYRSILDRQYDPPVYSRALSLLEDGERWQEAFQLAAKLAVVHTDVPSLLDDAERISEQFEQGSSELVSLFERVINVLHDKITKAELLVRLAGIVENRLGDPAGALNRYERAFREDPWREDLLEEIERLAIRAKQWDVLYAVQAIRLARMDDVAERFDYLLSMAEVVESGAGDKIRAFRMYLRAFLIEPSSDEVHDKLWKLARAIGTYPEEARFPRAIEPDVFLKGGLIALKRGRRGQSVGAKSPEVTMELDDGEMEIVEDGIQPVDDDMVVLDEADIVEEFTSPVERLAVGDLMEARKDSTRTGVTQEEILEDYGSDMFENPAAWSGRELPPAATAWEEYARAYAMLPYADEYEHAEHLLEIARIWKEGAEDPSRTLRTYQRAHLVLPQDEDIRESMISLARELGRVDETAKVVFTAARHSDENPQLASDLFRIAGHLYEEVSALNEAEASYREVLDIVQHDDDAYEGLRRIYTAREDWEALSQLEEWKLKIEDENWSLEEKSQKLRTLAEIFDTRIDDAERALEWWWRYLELETDDTEALMAALRRARQTKAWSKASEALEHLAELTDSEAERIKYLKERAKILEEELELPDQAIGVWRQILEMDEHDQDALIALDRLYSAHELLSDLEEILSLRMDITEGDQRIRLMERKARVLEDLIRDQEAAQLYEELYSLTSDPSFALKASDLYMESGNPERSIRIVKGMLEQDPSRYSRSEQGDMWVGLARLQIKALDERDEGMKSLEKALEIDPENISALTLLAELAKEKGDDERFAELQERIGALSDDDSESAAAFFVAATTWLGMERKDEALKALVEVLRRNPEHTEALVELQKLYEERHVWDKAIKIILKRAELAFSNEDKSALYTRAGQLYLTEIDDEDSAYGYFARALELDPDNVQAISAQADLAEKRGEWEEASRLLEAALTKMRDEPKKSSMLARRYAKLMMHLGRLDDAIVLLQELERRHPSSFFIKLTLGEIRYETRRWREASKILSSLVRLSEAEEHPEELSRALYLAGEAEMQQKKVTSAVELWKKAVDLDPRNEQAIDALVQYHKERGEAEAAVEYLELKGELLPPGERFGHYLNLGELYASQVGREEEALSAYLTALREGGAERIPVDALEKAFDYAKLFDRHEEMIELGAAILSRLEDEAARIPLLIEVGRLAVDYGHYDSARTWLEEAYKRSPLREDVVMSLAQIYFGEERYQDVVRILGDFFQKRIKHDPSLFKYHGLALMHLGKQDEAEKVLREAVEASPGDVKVIRGLISLVPDDSEDAVRFREMLLDADPTDEDAIRFLADYHKGDARLTYLQALELVGRISEEEQALLDRVRSRLSDPDLSFKGRLDDAMRDMIIGPQKDTISPVDELFEIVWEAAPSILQGDLASLGLSKENRVSPVDKSVYGRVYGAVSRALGTRRGALYFSSDFSGISVIAQAPPIVLVGGDLASVSPVMIRFLLARAMEQTQPAYLFAAGLTPEDFNTFFMGLVRAFHPKYSNRTLRASEPVDQKASFFRKQIPIRVSKRLTEFFDTHRDLQFSSGQWRKAVWTVAHKFGHLLAGDLRETLGTIHFEETGEPLPDTDSLKLIIRKVPELKEVLRFHLSPAHRTIRERLGYASILEDAYGQE